MLASRVLITAGTPGHMYLDERQAKWLFFCTRGVGDWRRKENGKKDTERLIRSDSLKTNSAAGFIKTVYKRYQTMTSCRDGALLGAHKAEALLSGLIVFSNRVNSGKRIMDRSVNGVENETLRVTDVMAW